VDNVTWVVLWGAATREMNPDMGVGEKEEEFESVMSVEMVMREREGLEVRRRE